MKVSDWTVKEKLAVFLKAEMIIFRGYRIEIDIRMLGGTQLLTYADKRGGDEKAKNLGDIECELPLFFATREVKSIRA